MKCHLQGTTKLLRISQQLQLGSLGLPRIALASSQSWSGEELIRTQPSLERDGVCLQLYHSEPNRS